MADQERIDASREEVLAATNEHILEAPHNVEVALRVHRRKITRMQPSLSINGLGSLLRHVVVAYHDPEATIAQLATLSDWHHLARRRIDDLDFVMGQWFAHGRRFPPERILRSRR